MDLSRTQDHLLTSSICTEHSHRPFPTVLILSVLLVHLHPWLRVPSCGSRAFSSTPTPLYTHFTPGSSRCSRVFPGFFSFPGSICSSFFPLSDSCSVLGCLRLLLRRRKKPFPSSSYIISHPYTCPLHFPHFFIYVFLYNLIFLPPPFLPYSFS